eukprot:355459-Chlamydomonas_euryale.AAC.1
MVTAMSTGAVTDTAATQQGKGARGGSAGSMSAVRLLRQGWRMSAVRLLQQGYGEEQLVQLHTAVSDSAHGRRTEVAWERQARQVVHGALCTAWCIALGAWCMAHGVWCMAYGAWCMLYGAWCMVHGAWCVAHGAWCMAHGAWCMAHGAWRMAHGAWCGAWCMVRGAWCMAHECMLPSVFRMVHGA